MFKATTLELSAERSLHLVQGGSGPDLLLVHGAVATHQDWLAGPARRLAKSYRVTIVDRPGHGLSRRPRFAGTPRDQAEQIADGLSRVGIERPVIAAHSFGALVSLALAERMPERVAALVLVAPLAFPEPRLLEHSLIAPRSMPVLGPMLSRMGQGSGFDRAMLELLQATMFSPEPVPVAWKESFPYDRVLDPDRLVLEGEDCAAILPMSPAGTIDLRRVEAPAHILTGTRDKVVEDERQGKALARLLPNARLTEIEGGGHMIHHSHPDLLVSAISEAAAPADA